MEGFSRRTFLKRGGTGAAAVGLLAAIPAFPGRAWGSVRPATSHGPGVVTTAEPEATRPLVVHIPDPRKGDVHLMVGTREVIRRDPALVARLVRAAG